MKHRLTTLLNPKLQPDLGTLCRVLSNFLHNTSQKYRVNRSGVREWLTDYEYCTGCDSKIWTSEREGHRSYAAHVQGMQITMLAALLHEGAPFVEWRGTEGIGLGSVFDLYNSKHSYPQKAFDSFMELEGQRVEYSANSFHKNAKVLCCPALHVSERAISLHVSVACPSDFKSSRRGCSRWDLGSLLKNQPIWKPARENFEAYCVRAKEFFLTGG